jgi:hypothetical protein
MSAEQDMLTRDPSLGRRVDELRCDFEANKDFPDVVAAWEAIARISARNRELTSQGEAPYPMPEWLNSYLLRSAEKIGRLGLGISPSDDRSFDEIGFDNIGELRKVLQGDRYRDDRANHVAPALGFVRKGANAFQAHDRAETDAGYLRVHDNPDLADNRPSQREVRKLLAGVIKKNERFATDEAVRNRLSAARSRRARRNVTKPASQLDD